MSVDNEGKLIEPKGGWAAASKQEIDQFFQRMISLTDDITLPSDYRASVTKTMKDVHAKLQSIPATMSEANRWTEIVAILALAEYWLPDLKPVAAVKPVPAIPSVETPTAVAESPELDAPEFF